MARHLLSNNSITRSSYLIDTINTILRWISLFFSSPPLLPPPSSYPSRVFSCLLLILAHPVVSWKIRIIFMRCRRHADSEKRTGHNGGTAIHAARFTLQLAVARLLSWFNTDSTGEREKVSAWVDCLDDVCLVFSFGTMRNDRVKNYIRKNVFTKRKFEISKYEIS